jgi:ligand-binding SRPBCC domain-containing protein
MKTRLFERTIWIPSAIEEVFSFFSQAENLEAVTPQWLGFRITTPLPITMSLGARIDYEIRLYRVPIAWRTEITAWEPPYRFQDTQLSGPYRIWVHDHLFREEGGRTEMTDRVRYRARGAAAAPLIERFFVRPSLTRIFDFRESAFRTIFAIRAKRAIGDSPGVRQSDPAS